MIGLNLRSVFVGCKAALAHLPSGGSIVNVASIAGFGRPGHRRLRGGQGGRDRLTPPWPWRRPPRGRVNCLAPGWSEPP